MVVEAGRGGGPLWTPERGIIDGLSCLKRTKELDGVEGEGMREFMHLVLKSTTGACGCLNDKPSIEKVGGSYGNSGEEPSS